MDELPLPQEDESSGVEVLTLCRNRSNGTASGLGLPTSPTLKSYKNTRVGNCTCTTVFILKMHACRCVFVFCCPRQPNFDKQNYCLAKKKGGDVRGGGGATDLDDNEIQNSYTPRHWGTQLCIKYPQCLEYTYICTRADEGRVQNKDSILVGHSKHSHVSSSEFYSQPKAHFERPFAQKGHKNSQ